MRNKTPESARTHVGRLPNDAEVRSIVEREQASERALRDALDYVAQLSAQASERDMAADSAPQPGAHRYRFPPATPGEAVSAAQRQ